MRFLPAAITPLRTRDLIAGLVAGRCSAALTRFESELASFFGRRGAWTFNSLMRTVWAAMLLVRARSRGNKIVLSRYSCPSFAHGILAAEFEILYVDADPRTLAFDMEALRRIDWSDVAGVLCASLFGHVYPMRELQELCTMHDAQLVEGVDYGIGGRYAGKRLGELGDIAILNFQEGKAIPIGGGAVVADDVPAMERIFSERGRGRSGPNPITLTGLRFLQIPPLYWLFMRASRLMRSNLQKRFSMEDTIRKTSTEHDFEFDAGSGLASVSGFQAKIGSRVLARLPRDAVIRRENAEFLHERLADVPGLSRIEAQSELSEAHWIRYPVLVPAELRDALIEELWQHGFEASRMYLDHGMNIDAERFPGAHRVMRELVTLPCHPRVRPKDRERLVALVRSFLESRT